MAETLINKNQAESGIWTQDNLVAGKDIEIRQRAEGGWKDFSSSNFLITKYGLRLNTTWKCLAHVKTPASTGTVGNGVFGFTTSESNKNGFSLYSYYDNNGFHFEGAVAKTYNSWLLDMQPTVGGLSLDTEYYVDFSFTGTEYILTIATDENFTNIVGTNSVSNSSAAYFNGSVYGYMGIEARFNNWYFRGTIYEVKIISGDTVVFNSSDSSTYTIQGTPTNNVVLVNTINNTLDVSGKQDALTTATGYDATKTQVLKNVNGTLTWVDEA